MEKVSHTDAYISTEDLLYDKRSKMCVQRPPPKSKVPISPSEDLDESARDVWEKHFINVVSSNRR